MPAYGRALLRTVLMTYPSVSDRAVVITPSYGNPSIRSRQVARSGNLPYFVTSLKVFPASVVSNSKEWTELWRQYTLNEGRNRSESLIRVRAIKSAVPVSIGTIALESVRL